MSNIFKGEPFVDNDDLLTDAWFAWLRSHNTAELAKLADYWGAWAPADDPGVNPDLVAEKWESACAEIAGREKSE